MRRHEHITAKHVLDADLRIRSIGVRRAIRDLEREEPDLAEYLMETSTRLYARLDHLCPHPRAARAMHRQVVLATLICVEAVRRSA
jgi:uncharacterized protein (DUF2461 family)